jgi:putative membrane protein
MFCAVVALSATVFGVPAFANSGTAGKTQASTAQRDTEFLEAVNQGCIDQMELARIALKKATDDELKIFAQRMIDDHTQMLATLRRFDDEAGVSVPQAEDAATKAEEAKLNALSGDAFDNAYVQAMIADHFNDVTAFRAEEKETGYPAFKAALAACEQLALHHLQQIDGIGTKRGVPPELVSGM